MGEIPSLPELMICRIPGINGAEKIELAKRFDNEEDLEGLSKKDIENILGKILKVKHWDMTEVRSLAEKDAELAHKWGIRRVSWKEASYPPLLREAHDPPLLLFYRGFLPDPVKPLVAIVGTRKPTQTGRLRAFAYGKELGEAGIQVVSGLALGIDAMAHRGNIEGRASTVAVLGSGPDQVYPSSNRDLARRILETGGCLISEYPPGTGVQKWHFPARNRIISGLARGTVIVEAPQKSGALITAKFALDQNRDLWVDREGVNSAQGKGAAFLAEEGAKVISSVRDILSEWNMAGLAGDRTELNESGEAKQTAASRREQGKRLASSLAEYLDIKL